MWSLYASNKQADACNKQAAREEEKIEDETMAAGGCTTYDTIRPAFALQILMDHHAVE